MSPPPLPEELQSPDLLALNSVSITPVSLSALGPVFGFLDNVRLFCLVGTLPQWNPTRALWGLLLLLTVDLGNPEPTLQTPHSTGLAPWKTAAWSSGWTSGCSCFCSGEPCGGVRPHASLCPPRVSEGHTPRGDWWVPGSCASAQRGHASRFQRGPPPAAGAEALFPRPSGSPCGAHLQEGSEPCAALGVPWGSSTVSGMTVVLTSSGIGTPDSGNKSLEVPSPPCADVVPSQHGPSRGCVAASRRFCLAALGRDLSPEPSSDSPMP